MHGECFCLDEACSVYTLDTVGRFLAFARNGPGPEDKSVTIVYRVEPCPGRVTGWTSELIMSAKSARRMAPEPWLGWLPRAMQSRALACPTWRREEISLKSYHISMTIPRSVRRGLTSPQSRQEPFGPPSSTFFPPLAPSCAENVVLRRTGNYVNAFKSLGLITLRRMSHKILAFVRTLITTSEVLYVISDKLASRALSPFLA